MALTSLTSITSLISLTPPFAVPCYHNRIKNDACLDKRGRHHALYARHEHYLTGASPE